MSINAPHIIDGQALARTTNAVTAQQVAQLQARGITPHMAILLVGDYEPSHIYVRNKKRAASVIGIATTLHHEPASITQQALLARVQHLSADPHIHGIIVQMPLPAHLDSNAVLDAVAPAKDIDGLTTLNLGRLFTGQDCFVPCTPQGCLRLIHSVRPSIAGLHAVVIGRSRLVGKPLAMLLQQQNCSVTVLHSQSVNPQAICRTADIVCVAAGKAGLVTADWVKDGAIIIDVGINRMTDGTLAGDVDFASVAPKASAITPVPKGVGPMTIACLLANTVYAAAQQNHIKLAPS